MRAKDPARASVLGLAGEFRVMSEFLLRGHNPAKSYLEKGPDLILENGLKIEVKCGHRYSPKSRGQRTPRYLFSFRGGNREEQDLTKVHFVICWCVDEDLFYVIPSKIVTASAIEITNTSVEARTKYAPYRENWEQLNLGGRNA